MKRAVELAALSTTAAVLSAGLALPAAPRAADAERSFTLSTDPTAVVLQYRFSGGMRPSVVYTLYGDGRLVHERVNQAARDTSEHLEMQLAPQEAIELVSIPVSAGLVECDGACIEGKVMDSLELRVVPRSADGGEVLLVLNLVTYQGPGLPIEGPVHRRIHLNSPHSLAEYCPEIKELQSVLDTGRALRQYKEAAQEGQQ